MPDQEDAILLLLTEQQLFLPCPGLQHVDRGEDAPIRDLAVKNELEVARALELLEDHFIHPRTGAHEGGRDDRQGTTAVNAPGGAEESLGFLERFRVDAAGEDLPGHRRDGVVRPSEARDGVEEDDDVLSRFDKTLGLFDDHIRHLHMPGRRLIKRRADDLGAGNSGDEVRHLLRPLVDEQHDESHLRVVLGDRVRHLLQEDRLAGPWRGHNQPALPLAERGDHVNDAHGEVARLGFEANALVRVSRPQVVEGDALLDRLRIHPVDRFDLQQCEVLLPGLGRAHTAADRVAGFHVEPADLRL